MSGDGSAPQSTDQRVKEGTVRLQTERSASRYGPSVWLNESVMTDWMRRYWRTGRRMPARGYSRKTVSRPQWNWREGLMRPR